MKDYYELYRRCFPGFPTTPENFDRLLRPDLAHIVERREDGRLIGCAFVHNGSIPMLCVEEAYRGQGVGSQLLAESEEYLRSLGSPKAVLGCGEHYLLQGVPEGPAVKFFEKRGYAADWTSINMELDLAGFDSARLNIPSAPEGLAYRFAEKSDLPGLLKAVEAAEAPWVSIFADIFADKYVADPILLAELDGGIAGFEILSTDGGYFISPGQQTASVGCVGVIPQQRERGIGLAMVAQGVQWLKEQGCARIELRFTWLESWYGKLGFRTVSRQWMGEKAL